MRIKIVGIPSGSAPEEMRQCWVGIEMESIGQGEVGDKELLVRKGNLGGYKVFGEVAFQALKTYDKEAYDWWEENYPEYKRRTLTFRTEICEEVPPCP